ncbi:MAG: HypC/HybG/HupF family hydrogenase formation chaperone [Deltaproteobacteria bacterium]|nr:HypC/HybG/HupF family hydrogenase formation chaperone [Deltaproteobacteria bacterium]MBW2098696.1 HypC/HybG/HupF family hydrogenase formation chaperone [Deltaproteobacteria bacterium]
MCLGIPGKVVSIKGDFAEVDFGGVRMKVSLLLSPDVSEGDYVLVHVGFAIQRLGQQEAIETLRLFKEIDRGYVDSIEGNG